MNIIHNQNVAFRCPNTLKEKLQQYAEENDLRVSSVIRTACVEWLKKSGSYKEQQRLPTSSYSASDRQ